MTSAAVVAWARVRASRARGAPTNQRVARQAARGVRAGGPPTRRAHRPAKPAPAGGESRCSLLPCERVCRNAAFGPPHTQDAFTLFCCFEASPKCTIIAVAFGVARSVRYSANASNTACAACLPGTIQAASGQKGCTECDPGTFQASSGSPFCEACPAGYSSLRGSPTCGLCAAR